MASHNAKPSVMIGDGENDALGVAAKADQAQQPSLRHGLQRWPLPEIGHADPTPEHLFSYQWPGGARQIS
jgi:hypothetical protein